MLGRELLLRAARAAQVFTAHLAWLLTVFLVSAGLLPWYALVMPVALLAFTHGVRRPRSAPVESPSTPRLDLKAPNPAPGQCPVCGLEDLDERAAGDDLLGDAGTALAKVVPYGPDRAHFECAATVPYVDRAAARAEREREHLAGQHRLGAKYDCPICADPSRDPQRELVHLLGGVTMQHMGYGLAGTLDLCRCAQCERTRPRPAKGGYAAGNVTVSEMGPLPEVLTRPGLGQPVVNNTLRGSVEARMDAHLVWAGSHSWESWQHHGFETRSEAAAWYRLGFTPWRAERWRQAGFTDPDAVARTGYTWPLFEPERDGP